MTTIISIMWQPPHLPLQASMLAGHADGEWAANIERWQRGYVKCLLKLHHLHFQC